MEQAASATPLAILEPDTAPKARQEVAIVGGNLLQMAVQRGASLDEIRELRSLQKEWEADEARKAFNSAFAAFKAEAVRIVKSTTVTDGPLKGKSYAKLHDVVNAITPALSKHGLSAAWKLTKDEKDWLEVTCTLSHQQGHSESVSMGGPPDSGGAKNAIQARASSVSYLERYTLKAITGLAEQEDDNDGAGSGQALVSADQAATLKAMLDECTPVSRKGFLAFMKVAKVDDIPAGAYAVACDLIDAKRREAAKGGTK